MRWGSNGKKAKEKGRYGEVIQEEGEKTAKEGKRSRIGKKRESEKWGNTGKEERLRE